MFTESWSRDQLMQKAYRLSNTWYHPPGYGKVERDSFMTGLHPNFIEIHCNSATDWEVRFSKNSLFASNFISTWPSNIRFDVWLVFDCWCPLIILEISQQCSWANKTDWLSSFQLFTFYFNICWLWKEKLVSAAVNNGYVTVVWFTTRWDLFS